MWKIVWYVFIEEGIKKGPFKSLKELYDNIDTSKYYLIIPIVETSKKTSGS